MSRAEYDVSEFPRSTTLPHGERNRLTYLPRGAHGTHACRDKWAKTQSANKDIKVYIGAPASWDAAGTGYVDVGTLANYAKHAQKTWSSFGGVMLWEVSLAVGECESLRSTFYVF